MNNCPTGYCGYPCYCEGSLDHIDREEAESLSKLVSKRINDIDAKTASDEHDMQLVGYPAVEVRLVAMELNGQIKKLDHLIQRVVLRKDSSGIRTLSGLKSVLIDNDGNISFVAGHTRETRTCFNYVVLEWNGEVSASAKSDSPIIDNIFLKLVDTMVYLPANME